jgi:hypothetical protein
LLCKKLLVLSAARKAWNAEWLKCCSYGEWGDARFEGGRDNFIRSISDSVEKALRKIETLVIGATRVGRLGT